jgi:hypothetical protein
MRPQGFWYTPAGIQLCGYVIMAAGGITILDYYRRKLFLGFPPDLGIITADVALLVLGSLAIMIAGCLKTFQGRLDGMEASIPRSDPGTLGAPGNSRIATPI